MLTYNSLLEQARLRGMPTTKMRGILREYLQVIILKELSRLDTAQGFYFTGGTYLRLAHGLKRVSEDLDFNVKGVTVRGFEKLLAAVCSGLKRSGISVKADFIHWGNILSAVLTFPEIEKNYGITSRFSKKTGIAIKVEANKPKWKIKAETQVISAFGEVFPCLCTAVSQLFADKIDALGKKERGRHIYDIIFMLSNKFPIDKYALRALGIKEEPFKAIEKRSVVFQKAKLRKLAEALRPFLFEESEAELVARAHTIIPGLIGKYM